MELKNIFGEVIFALDGAKTVLELVTAAVAAKKSLNYANLVGACLDRANLVGANLDDACLDRANLVGANLVGANLVRARLVGASLDGASLVGARLVGASLDRASLDRARLDRARLVGARLVGANLVGANLDGACLDRASLDRASLDRARLVGACLDGKPIAALRVFSGLYDYQVWAVLFKDGSRKVRMGCLFYDLDKWETIGIRKSNPSEFPDDGSEKSENRADAFEFAKAAALRMVEP